MEQRPHLRVLWPARSVLSDNMAAVREHSSDVIEVYEHGIEVAGDAPQGLLRMATRENNLVYSGYTLAILDQDGSSLNHRAALLFQVPVAHDGRALYEVRRRATTRIS
jgi:hypothetical protein